MPETGEIYGVRRQHYGFGVHYTFNEGVRRYHTTVSCKSANCRMTQRLIGQCAENCWTFFWSFIKGPQHFMDKGHVTEYFAIITEKEAKKKKCMWDRTGTIP